MKPEIFSEIGPLERVIVYSPGEEHNLVLPNNIQPYVLENNKVIQNDKFFLFQAEFSAFSG